MEEFALQEFFAYVRVQIVQSFSPFPAINGRQFLIFPSERGKEDFGPQNHRLKTHPLRKSVHFVSNCCFRSRLRRAHQAPYRWRLSVLLSRLLFLVFPYPSQSHRKHHYQSQAAAKLHLAPSADEMLLKTIRNINPAVHALYRCALFVEAIELHGGARQR